ncbi:FAD/NAD(P)-binding protein [Microbulbifer sp. Q7]|uniref:FAD/NAD(P)-binding protein n=1 Tax=Microbulbifer sp. Q7 TaxID=1785091 RepID=UPI00082FCFEA|nr:FAD/NAD(P)-binding protein [Microbulbifer sp. Q7]
MIPEAFRVVRRSEEYAGTFTLHIEHKGGKPLASFAPGQFNMLYAFGSGEVPISMSGRVEDSGTYVHTIRAHGLATQSLERLRAGDELGVRGPFGQGWPMQEVADKHVLIIAGGLGLAPLRPAIYSLLSGAQPCRSLRLFYGARGPQEMLYIDELRHWQTQVAAVLTVDQADDEWHGAVGVITGPLAASTIDADNTIVFLCGPEVMMRFCVQTLLAKGLSESRIYLSMERNMKCATGHCGHCQWGPQFVCKDGPVFNYGSVRPWFKIRAL